jgi:hypothetical protein
LARLHFATAIWRRGPQRPPALGILLPLTISADVPLSVVVEQSLQTVVAAPYGHGLADAAIDPADVLLGVVDPGL